MSQKRKVQRSNHSAQEKKQGEKVVYWIFGVLIALAIFYAIYTMILVG